MATTTLPKGIRTDHPQLHRQHTVGFASTGSAKAACRPRRKSGEREPVCGASRIELAGP